MPAAETGKQGAASQVFVSQVLTSQSRYQQQKHLPSLTNCELQAKNLTVQQNLPTIDFSTSTRLISQTLSLFHGL